MPKNLFMRILVILGILVGSFLCTYPFDKHINLGLDLKGGMHLVIHVDTQNLDENAKKDAVLRAIEILRNRIDGLGVGETVIQQQGENQILVQLPGITDREAALALVGQVAQLEFRLVHENQSDLKKALDGQIPDGYILKYSKDEDKEPLLLKEEVAISGEYIADAHVDFDQMNQPFISISFDSEGSKIFGSMTQSNIGKRLAIVLDGEVLSAPTIQDAIYGNGQITGRFTFEEASRLALALRSGALPAPIKIEEERTVGPLLGKDSIKAGINATILAGILVVCFMFLYYLKAGFIANIALVLNVVMIFGIMGFLNLTLPDAQVTLTLPGIAGIILTLGMAVDANVLINERIREEIEAGRTLAMAIRLGFERALSAIIDSNVTTLIAAFFLFQFGSGPIKGFAVTLSIGLLSSLFTAVYVSKTFFFLFLQLGWIKDKITMLRLFTATKINFVSKMPVALTFSVILVVLSIVILFVKGENAYGIDFSGGQIQEFRFTKPVPADNLRLALKNAGIEDAIIQQFDQYPENVIIRTSDGEKKTDKKEVKKGENILEFLENIPVMETEAQQNGAIEIKFQTPIEDQPKDIYNEVTKAFLKTFPDNKFEVLRVEQVGPVVGKALRKAALLAILLALCGILVYVGFRFKHFDFATAGVIALLHDVTVTFGILLMLGRQIDLLVVTALLTIAGFSINDTIVIYDRVRENFSKMPRVPLKDIINLTINQMLARTIITNLTAFLVVLSLFFKGGEVLNTFSLSLVIGFIAGTYSTIFIASPLVLFWERKK